MRLIVITQKVDKSDSNLGFFHSWLEKLSFKLDKLFAVGLSVGQHCLPQNTVVFSLGREKGCGKVRQFFRLQKFLWRNLKQADGVLCHMCPIFAVSSWFLSRVFRKKLVLWYAHGTVSFLLRLAVFLSDRVLTSSELCCRVKSRKVKVIGHGIDVSKFKIQKSKFKNARFQIAEGEKEFKILYIGRIGPVKKIEVLVEAVNILVKKKGFVNLQVDIAGEPVGEREKLYFQNLKNLIAEKGLKNIFEFLGKVPHDKAVQLYQRADLFVNPSQTGSLDKTVLESMSSGCLVLTANPAYQKMLDEKYFFRAGDAGQLAEKIIALKEMSESEKRQAGEYLREITAKNHSLHHWTKQVIAEFKE